MNRNDPCPCGSGKKYKKCCMLASGGAGPAPANPAVDVNAMLNHAYAHQQAGRFEEAERLYRRVLAAEPTRIVALVNLGQIREQIGDLDESETLFRRVVACPDAKADHFVSLSALLRARGEVDGALELAKHALQLDAQSIRAHLLEAEILRQMNRVDEARVAAERVLSVAPDHPATGVFVASLDRHAGRLDEAERRLEQIISSETDPEQLHRAFKELGMVLDAQGRYDEAFDALVRGGTEGTRTDAARRADRNHWARWLGGYKRHLSPDLLARWTAEQHDDGLESPAFLVGFPRSGTTMTERILGAHPAIIASDEQPFVRGLIIDMAQMLGDGEIPVLLKRLEVAHVRTLRAAYWERARKYAGSDLDGRQLVDKTPLNIMHLGLINVVFPQAKVIVALRDPRDVCLSCLMQRFALNSATVHLLTWESTVDFYDRVMDLWLHLRDMLTLEHLQIRYEDTVQDLEGQARRMLDFLGLEWDERVLDFHKTAANRYISTPSFAAVARPVHGGAIGRWRSYETQIASTMPRLDRYVDEFGYR